MNGQTEVSPTGQLLLSRLLVAGEKGATGAELKRALEPILGHRWTGAALGERIAQELASLDAAGLVVRSRKGRTERAALTPEGRGQTLKLLGLDELPPKTTWDKLKKTYLAARALGLPSPQGEKAKRFATENGFKAALLRARFELPLGEHPKVEEAISALCWKLLGFTDTRKFDVKTVQAALLQRALGDDRELGPKPDPKKEAAKLLAKEVGARQAGKDELRLATLRGWIGHEPGAVSAPPGGWAEASRPTILVGMVGLEDSAHSTVGEIRNSPLVHELPTLSQFADQVLAAARSTHSGRFGDNKVFISHVWRRLQEDSGMSALSLDAFKQRLAEANQARLLDLARADLVEAMDPEDVRSSELSYHGATFHFVRIG